MSSSLSALIASVVDTDTLFGPSPDHLPPQFKDIPYAPFSKNDKLGRVVDWNQESSGSYDRPAAGGATNGTQGTRRTAQTGATQSGSGGKYGREPKEAFGAGSAGTFAYFHDEDEASFSLVDGSKSGAAKRGGGGGGGGGGSGSGLIGKTSQFTRGARGGARGAGASGRGAARNGAQGGRQDFSARGGRGGGRGGASGGRFGWKDYTKEARTRDASVSIGSDWAVLEEIEFSRLSKLRLEVDTLEPETVSSHGFLYEYDKVYDRVNTKNEKPLQIIERLRYNPTTSDDPIIQELAAKDTAQIFATDSILSMLMCTTRSVYPWDIVLTREGDKLFMDKREGGPFDYPSVNENASDPPLENEKDTLNSPSALSLEATYINQNFAFQVVREDPASRLELEHPNPFYSSDETEPLASCAYRYRKFDLSTTDEEDVQIIVRTEVDSFIKSTTNGEEDTYITIKTLNEFDSRSQGSGGAPEWRSKLDSQRGAVVATEMKNNSSKLARWAVQSILAGAEQMKMGYVSRANARDASRHTILGTQWYKPRDFASQMNINLSNGWGVVRTIADLCLKQPEGKYLLLKDPNKPVIRLYSVPSDVFEVNEEIEDDMLSGNGSDGEIITGISGFYQPTVQQTPTLKTFATLTRKTRIMSIRFIDPKEMATMILENDTTTFKVIDVRDSDFEGGNITGAINVPSESFAADELVKTLKDVPVVIFHCALSQVRGPRAARMYSDELQRQSLPINHLTASTISSDSSSPTTTSNPTSSLNPFTSPAIIKPKQEVLVLRGGFTDFQALYRKDPKLVEKLDLDVWGNYSQ